MQLPCWRSPEKPLPARSCLAPAPAERDPSRFLERLPACTSGRLLFLEEIEEGLPVTAFLYRSRPASLFFNEDFGLKQVAQIIGIFVGYADFDGLYAFIACRRVKVEAVAACM